MAGSTNSNSNFGSFVATTNSWEIQQLQSSNADPQLKELLVRLYQNINTIALALNTKESGLYDTQEFLTGQIYFPTANQSEVNAMTPLYRPVFRQVISFGPLPNTATVTQPHNLPVNFGWLFTHIYGVATSDDSTSFIPLPYASATLNENISVDVDNTNVSITTAIDYSAYTTTYVVLEYLKE